MMRWTVCLAALATLFASTTELEAQRRAPVRNMIRTFGHGWGSGNHYRNPGHNSSHYVPWSETNSSYANDGNAEPTPAPNTAPVQAAREYTPGAKSIWQNPANSKHIQPTFHPHYLPATTTVIRTPDQNLNTQAYRIQHQLKPYHLKTKSPNAVQLKHGGNFQIPTRPTEWNSDR